MVHNGTDGFAMVWAGSEPARTVNQSKDVEAMNRISPV